MTAALKGQLAQIGVEAEYFAQQFTLWKADWPRNEYSFELFGKDGAYRAPLVDGERDVLRHVHLMPLPGSKGLRAWITKFRHRGRKVSDRHLVYVEYKPRGYLLIFILDEPYAHSVAEMRTAEDRELMGRFALIAENYIIDGEVP